MIFATFPHFEIGPFQAIKRPKLIFCDPKSVQASKYSLKWLFCLHLSGGGGKGSKYGLNVHIFGTIQPTKILTIKSEIRY